MADPIPNPPPGLNAEGRRAWSKTVRLLDDIGLLDQAIASNSLQVYVACFQTVAMRDER
jgi:hypothetical protein